MEVKGGKAGPRGLSVYFSNEKTMEKLIFINFITKFHTSFEYKEKQRCKTSI
jgi:hypothetical protein